MCFVLLHSQPSVCNVHLFDTPMLYPVTGYASNLEYLPVGPGGVVRFHKYMVFEFGSFNVRQMQQT